MNVDIPPPFLTSSRSVFFSVIFIKYYFTHYLLDTSKIFLHVIVVVNLNVVVVVVVIYDVIIAGDCPQDVFC